MPGQLGRVQGLSTRLRNVVAIAIAIAALLSQGWNGQACVNASALPTVSAADDGVVHLIALTQGEVKVAPPCVQVKDPFSEVRVALQRYAPPKIASHPLARMDAVDDLTPRRHSWVGIVELRI